ncbi:hypothetical protein K470DRAFT_36897 [Piedraia hortae CBS 480.64]|uniref:Uncharacterized protein n=1 Tax=Piedraia hortae CBS 480.64 TaxID=1314780 RepID=A0A6A7C432_9PEZI|nr:hypothetical protein K470DRAFT_36897 [Piedraia hortae CBS 480.64]
MAHHTHFSAAGQHVGPGLFPSGEREDRSSHWPLPAPPPPPDGAVGDGRDGRPKRPPPRPQRPDEADIGILEPPRPPIRPPLGPPPSSRRGPPSYYQHQHLAPVHSIAEESESTSRASGLTSRSNLTGHESTRSFASSTAIPIGFASSPREGPPPAWASLAHPSSRPLSEATSAYSDSLADAPPLPQPLHLRQGPQPASDAVMVRTASLGRKSRPTLTTVRKSSSGDPYSPRSEQFHQSQPSGSILETGTGLIDASSDSEDELESSPKDSLTNSRDGLRTNAAAIFTYSPTEQTPASVPAPIVAVGNGFSQRRSQRLPPEISIDTIKKAEARGSLTSLPDLIQRATKLAVNLDRGRTASRLDMVDVDDRMEKVRSPSPKQETRFEPVNVDPKIPPPRPAPPEHAYIGSRIVEDTQWNPPPVRSQSVCNDRDRPSRKHYCGLPLWLLMALLVGLAMLVSAAIAVPIVLTQSQTAHIHRGNETQTSRGVPAACTGAACGSTLEQGCTQSGNVVIGEAIPALVKAAGQFNLALDSVTLAEKFANLQVGCVDQNALVTFQTAPLSWNSHDPGAAATKSGIVYATNAPKKAAVEATPPTGAARTLVDFAGVTVLYVFNATEDENAAVDAQTRLQQTLGNRGNVSIGSGFWCDTSDYQLGRTQSSN